MTGLVSNTTGYDWIGLLYEMMWLDWSPIRLDITGLVSNRTGYDWISLLYDWICLQYDWIWLNWSLIWIHMTWLVSYQKYVQKIKYLLDIKFGTINIMIPKTHLKLSWTRQRAPSQTVPVHASISTTHLWNFQKY